MLYFMYLHKVNRYYSRTESILRRDHEKFFRFRETDVIIYAKEPDISMDKHRQSSHVGNLSLSFFHFSCFVSYFFRLPFETEAVSLKKKDGGIILWVIMEKINGQLFCLKSYFIESINQLCLRRTLFRLREMSLSKRDK